MLRPLPRVFRVSKRGRLRPGTSTYFRLWMYQSGRCHICGKPMHFEVYDAATNPNGWTRDHVVPQSMGGRGRDSILLAHWACNQQKDNRLPTYSETLRAVAILGRVHRSHYTFVHAYFKKAHGRQTTAYGGCDERVRLPAL